MKTLAPYLIRTALSGLVLIIPLAVLFLAVMQVWEMLEEMTAFSGLHLPFPPVINGLIYAIVIVLALFVVCLLAGLAMRTRAGRRIDEFVQKSIVDRVPLLGLMKNLTMSLTGLNSELMPVEADINNSGAPVWGFLMETLDDGRHVVFVPTSPALTVGNTYLVPPDRVTLLDDSMAVVNVLSQWGVGASEVYRDNVQSER